METKLKRILVPVDFSACSIAALEYAARIARDAEAAITILHVCELPTQMSSIVPGADALVDLAGERADALLKLEQLSAEKSTWLENVPVEMTVEHGYATRNIIDGASTGGFDVIVMGTHGRTGFTRLIMGSIAQGVFRRASCPVIAVHLPDGS